MKRFGATLIEVLMAALVLGTVMGGFVLFQAATVKTNQKERDRAFALQKAVQMMEEIKVHSASDGAAQLDDYGQSDTTYSFELTTEPVANPSDPISDNSPEKVGYRYVRQIWVRPLPRDKGARQVTVRIFLSNKKAAPSVAANAKPLAAVSNIFKSMPTIVLPSQAYEVYRIAMWEFANSTGDPKNSYQYPTLYSSYGANASTYLQNANSGLDMTIRKDISKVAYGRDTYYAPLYNFDDYWAHVNSGYTAGSDITSQNKVPLNHVYFRPGMQYSHQGARLDQGYGQQRYWYSTEADQQYEPATPTEFRGTTPIKVVHDGSKAGLYEQQKPYTFADQNNHALRYIEHNEKAWARRSYAIQPTQTTHPYNGIQEKELTLRTLLDDLIEGKRKNAMIVNDHSEIFPFIPMRNYSDAAKVPFWKDNQASAAALWGVTATDSEAEKGSNARLVTHPRQLEYDMDETVQFRVYPHSTKDFQGEPPTMYQNGQIVLRGVDANLRDSLKSWNGGTAIDNIEIQAMVPVDTEADPGWFTYFPSGRDLSKNKKKKGKASQIRDFRAYRWVRIWPTNNNSLQNKDDYGNDDDYYIPYVSAYRTNFLTQNPFVQTGADATNDLRDGDVVIRLKSIPYSPGHVEQSDNDDEWDDDRYGQEKPLHGLNYYPDPNLPDLSQAYNKDAWRPRNTARFRILLKARNPITVEALTTIGSDPNLYHHQAPNRSRTWAWVGKSAPETERYQLIGDPRHNPYKDVRDGRRYNRFFGDLDDAYYEDDGDTSDNYFADTTNGWGPNNNVSGVPVGRADYDIPRYFELWRKALLNSNAMFGSITADAFRYVVLGSEYNQVPHSKQPMTGETGQKATYDERHNPTIVAEKGGDKWYAKPWLGELYPDDRFGDWINGNLPSSDFRRLEIQNIASFPSEVKFKRTRRVDAWGPLAFYNASERFVYKDNPNSTAKITSDSGRAVTADMKALLRETVSINRSFDLNDSFASVPVDWNWSATQNDRTRLEAGIVSGDPAYYKAQDGNLSVAPFVMRRDGQAAYFLAFTPWYAWGGSNDPMSMQRVFMASLMQGFLDMADPAYRNGGSKDEERIKLLPRIKVTQPEDDALVTGNSLTIKWEPEWVRWDGEPYSRQFSDYASSDDKPKLAYLVKYSENGSTWFYANSSPVMQTWIGSLARYNDFTRTYATSLKEINLNISTFKNKQYQIRIEAWRVDPGYEGVHHAYAQFAINRTK